MNKLQSKYRYILLKTIQLASLFPIWIIAKPKFPGLWLIFLGALILFGLAHYFEGRIKQ